MAGDVAEAIRKLREEAGRTGGGSPAPDPAPTPAEERLRALAERLSRSARADRVDAERAAARVPYGAYAPTGRPGAARAFGHGVADMATLGGADELAGAVTAAPGRAGLQSGFFWPNVGISALGVLADAAGYPNVINDEYARGRDIYRERQGASEEAHPGLFTAGQVGGALGLGGLLGALGGPGMVAGAAGRGLVPQTVRGIGLGMAGGAGEGLLSGFLGGEGLRDRLSGAAMGGTTGAAAGGVVGGLIPMAAAGIGGALASSASRSAARAPHMEILEEGVRGVPPDVLRANMARAGPHRMVADAAPQLAGTLDAAMTHSPTGRYIAGVATEDRASASRRLATDALDQHMGRPVGVQTRDRATREATRDERRAVYDEAYAQQLDYFGYEDDPLLKILDQVQSAAPGALGYARRMMVLRDEPIRPDPLFRTLDDGTEELLRVPDVREWDYITRALAAEARAEDAKGAMGGITAMGDAVRNVERRARGILRERVPEYGRALDTAGDVISQHEMLILGEGLFKASREEIRDALMEATPIQRQAMVEGLRDEIDERMANVARAVSDGNMDGREARQVLRDLSSRASREKITLLLGEDAASDLFKHMEWVEASLGLRASVARNSQTAPRQAQGQVVEERATGTTGAAVRRGEPVNAIRRVTQAVLGGTPRHMRKRVEEVWTPIAEMLVASGKDADEVLERIISAMEGRGIPVDMSRVRRATHGLTGALGASAYQPGQRYIEGQAFPTRK